MKNELLSIGPFTIYGYGLMIAIGVIAAYLISEKRAETVGVKKDSVFSMIMWCIIGGILGAKILFLITQIKEIIKNPSMLLDVSSGFVVYGGIIGGIFAGYLFARHSKQLFLNVFDLAMPSVALGQAFGRIGCFLAGCCYGKETQSAFHIVFHDSKFAPNNVQLIPTQLISSALDFANFFVLVLLTKKTKARGQVAALYLMFYSAGRFVLEYFRGDLIRGNVGALSTSQFIAIFLELIGIVLFIVWGKKYPKKELVEKVENTTEELEDSKENLEDLKNDSEIEEEILD